MTLSSFLQYQIRDYFKKYKGDRRPVFSFTAADLLFLMPFEFPRGSAFSVPDTHDTLFPESAFHSKISADGKPRETCNIRSP